MAIQMQIHKKIQKRSFQLLELLVAVSILLLCIAPIMRVFTNIYKGERQIMRENLRDHIANRVHASFTEALYKREIDLNDVEGEIALKDSDLIQLLQNSHCQCTGTFKVASSRKDKNEYKYLCSLKIQLKDLFPIQPELIPDKKHNPVESHYEYSIYATRAIIANPSDTTIPATSKQDSP